MLIYVRCITYDHKGKDKHLFNVKPTDTLLSFKQKIMKEFNVGEKIDMFDDKTERILDSYDQPISECFSVDRFYSVTFSE